MSGWVRVENTMPESLKVAPLNDRAFRLWMHALCYCSRVRTDGRVPAALVLSLSPSATRRAVDDLLAAGLFEPAEGGFLVHDYLEYNPSRARITELKRAAKKRTSRWRNGDGVTGSEVEQGDEDVTRHNHVTPHTRDRPVHSSVLQELFDYWKVNCKKTRAQFTDERQTKLNARLKQGYSVEDVKLGIDGAAANPPIDRDTGVVHDDLISICRNGAQLERYMARAKPNGARRPSTASDLLRKLDAADGLA